MRYPPRPPGWEAGIFCRTPFEASLRWQIRGQWVTVASETTHSGRTSRAARFSGWEGIGAFHGPPPPRAHVFVASGATGESIVAGWGVETSGLSTSMMSKCFHLPARKRNACTTASELIYSEQIAQAT